MHLRPIEIIYADLTQGKFASDLAIVEIKYKTACHYMNRCFGVASIRPKTHRTKRKMVRTAQADSLRVEVSPAGLEDADEIERGLDVFARGLNGGLIVTPSSRAIFYRDLIIKLTDRWYRLPAIYPFRLFVAWCFEFLWTSCVRPIPARSRVRRSHS
jgi:hypothetical protein